MATVRRERRIARPADDLWAVVGDPGSIHRWFPGIVDCTLGEDDEGRFRTVELASGLHLTERIVTVDPILRRFQYRITGAAFREHLGTVDVIDLGDGTSLVVYGTDARPDVLALVIGGASGEALEHLEQLVSEGAGR
ncbi:MAG TPA: SRPBCC family protein [Microthrixaceae bacterium]|nr:SRPBCC family protein [Microthrixaceae bacterium]